jgi:hypothetical protein
MFGESRRGRSTFLARIKFPKGGQLREKLEVFFRLSGFYLFMTEDALLNTP